MRKLLGGAILALVAFILVYVLGIQQNWYGEVLQPGVVAPVTEARHQVVTQRRAAQQQAAQVAQADTDKQILFGDLHVHTSYSLDAFLGSLPIMQGEGAHPLADACDFARYCSGLDFWSINDHAESLIPQRWRETKDMIRQCNAVAGDPENPDMVAFLGWEWTQIGSTPQNHYGHKNVVLLDTAEDKVPTRPIAAMGAALEKMQNSKTGPLKYLMPGLDFENRQDYYDFERFLRDSAQPLCPEGVDVRDLPVDCVEYATTPAELLAKLRQWDFPALLIPHGTGVGQHTPALTTWDQQLTDGNTDPRIQTTYEIYSGHGNSEEYRSWRELALDDEGKAYCPQPTEDYTAMCWRSGEIIRERCLASGVNAEECDERARTARDYAVTAGKNAFAVVGGSTVPEWLDAGQCMDCFQPVNELRPLMSAQAALATTNFKEGPGETERFRFALIGSSDNHNARAGTGFKEKGRHKAADIAGPKSQWLSSRINDMGEPLASPIPVTPADYVRFTERSRSFVYTGGLVAVHAPARDRQSIWNALQNKEVYGTSGPRILLWFDLLDDDGNALAAMGSELTSNKAPRFRVRAVGSFKQKPGCPEYAQNGLSAERLDALCYGECYHPGDERHRIERIEVVKITPQMTPGEALDELIHDDWQVLECEGDGDTCVVEFEDAEFDALQRDSLYYVRAVQEPTPTINGNTLRCEYDEQGNCIKVNPCYTHEGTDYADDCLAPSAHRAWSSPIFIDYASKE